MWWWWWLLLVVVGGGVLFSLGISHSVFVLCLLYLFPLTSPLQLVQTRSREQGFQGGMWEAGVQLVEASQWNVARYFVGVTAKLTMTVLNAALMFMAKESVLRMVLKCKNMAGNGVYRLLRWIAFVVVAFKVAKSLSEASSDRRRRKRRAQQRR